MKYFVSYTTRDKEVTLDLLILLANALKKRGNVFIDLIDNNSEDKQERIIKELENSDCLILISTKRIYESEWVIIELNLAKDKCIPIIALTVNQIKENNSLDKLIINTDFLPINPTP